MMELLPETKKFNLHLFIIHQPTSFSVSSLNSRMLRRVARLSSSKHDPIQEPVVRRVDSRERVDGRTWGSRM